MRMGKHVYVQKPLTHTVFEAPQYMRETAKKYGVCTQMGNQGSTFSGLRRGVEIVQDGLIGPVKEVHVWTDRPREIWKQAPDIIARPKGEFQVPKRIHWDEFLGAAARTALLARLPSLALARLLDFGTGAIGDMACHTANIAFRALKLGYPTSVVAEAGDVNAETYPSWAHVTMEFPHARRYACMHTRLVRRKAQRQEGSASGGPAQEGAQQKRTTGRQRFNPRRRKGGLIFAERLRREVSLNWRRYSRK